jgi:hypothetical protein
MTAQQRKKKILQDLRNRFPDEMLKDFVFTELLETYSRILYDEEKLQRDVDEYGHVEIVEMGDGRTKNQRRPESAALVQVRGQKISFSQKLMSYAKKAAEKKGDDLIK